jgi:DNA-binding transcriptional MerR regulator
MAHLVGVTVRTLRHYHQIGLLPEPDRTAGGYRVYGPSDVLLVLRIRRLVRTGLPLARVAELLEYSPGGTAGSALEELDRELERQIEQLQARRQEIAAMMGVGRLDVPARFVPALDSLQRAGSTASTIDEFKDLVELVDALAEEPERSQLAASAEALAADPAAEYLAELDARSRAIDDSTPDAEVEALVSETIVAIIEVAERELAKTSAGDETAPQDEAGMPQTITALAMASVEAGLTARGREALRRVVDAVAEHFGVELG